MTDVMKLSKKAFTWSVVVMTVLWSMGVSALVPLTAHGATCENLSSGDVFQIEGDPDKAVYLVNADLERMPFPHESVFKTWFKDFSALNTITGECGQLYPSSSRGVTYRPGSRLVKLKAFPAVYAVLPNAQKAHVASEAVAQSLYGNNWNQLVVDLPAVFDTYYTQASDLTEAIPHNGQLISIAGSSDVWYVSGGTRSKVSGSLPANVASDVRSVSQSVADTLNDSGNTVTAATVTSDPAQGAADGVVTPPPAAQGTLTVALAADTPQGTFGVESAIRVPFTKFNLTATGGAVTINSFKVIRTGSPAQDADFSKVNVLTPNGDLLNEAGKTLNADSMVTFTEDIVVPSGQTVTYTIVGDIAASVGGGNLPRLSLYSLDTGATVVGGLPLAGNPVEMNTNIALGSATLAEGAVVGTVTEQVGDADINLANLKITVATNDFQVEKIILNNTGTTSDGDIQNFELRYNNNKIADGVMKDKFLTFDLAGCTTDCKIPKGENRIYSVYGDIVNGSLRSMNLDVKRAAHVLVRDLKNNFYVSPTDSATAMTNTVTISEGRLTISKTNDTPAGNVAENSSNVTLASWNFKVQGESITVNTMSFKIVTTGSIVPTGFDNLTLFDKNGKALTGGADGVGALSPGYATSTDSFTLPVGDNLITLQASIDSTASDDDTVAISIDMNNSTNFDATGQDSGETLDLGTDAFPSSSFVTANTQTIKTAALRITTLTSPAAATLAAGTNNVTFAKLLFDSSASSEDIRVTQVKVTDTVGAAAKTIDIQNCELVVDKDGDSYNGAGTPVALTQSVSGTKTAAGTAEDFTFNLSGADQFTIKKGKKLEVTVRCAIAGGAVTGTTATHTFSTDTADDVAAVGVTTGNTVTEVIDTAAGQAITVGTAGGGVQVSIDAADPSQANYAAGTQGVSLNVFNFYATTTENVELDSIKFTMRVTATASSSFKDYSLLYAEDENGTVVGSVVPTSTTPVINFTDNSFIVNINDSDGAKLYLKANLASIGPQQTVTVGGHRLGFNITTATDVTAKGAQSGSGTTEFLGTDAPNGKTHYAYKATPTVTMLPVGGTLGNGTNDLIKFKVTANTGDIGLYKFTFDVTTTTASVSNYELVDVTDASEVSLYNVASAASSNIDYINVLLDDDNQTAGDGGEERTVSTSKPRTYVLRGTVTGSATGASISTRIGGDSAVWVENANLMGTAANIDSDLHDDFIWSDRSVGAHATSTADWVNGFLVTGLSSASSTPSVVAK